MGKVKVTVNDRAYEVACDDGQESHVQELAQFVDKRMSDLIRAVGRIDDSRLLLMTCLLIADELSEIRRNPPRLTADSATLSAVDLLANRIESIAARLEAL